MQWDENGLAKLLQFVKPFQKFRKVKRSGQRNAEFHKQEAMAATTNTARSGGTMAGLVGLMADKEMLIHWLIEEGLMAKERLCPMCDGEMSLARCEDQSDLFKWECRRQEKSKRHKAEILISGWFEKAK